MSEYWQWDSNKGMQHKLTPLHEALHASVSFILGGYCREVRLLSNGRAYSKTFGTSAWREVAVWLAPTLIGDISGGDEEWLISVNPHQRGYAWAWLKRNRKRILQRARRYAKKMGPVPGRLTWNLWTLQTVWKSTSRKVPPTKKGERDD